VPSDGLAKNNCEKGDDLMAYVQAHCRVTGAGPMADSGKIILFLTKESGSEVFPEGKELCFVAFEGLQREILATALTAISTGRTVWCDFGQENEFFPDVPGGDSSGTVRSMYLRSTH
jgi:hypothetical protein